MKIRLHDLKWPDVETFLRKPHALLVPVGSIEQHARHLPLNVDSRNAAYLAEKAAEKVINEQQMAVVVAPTINYTEVDTFESYPGTLGVSLETESRMISDIAGGAIKQGFKNIIFINGHMSNVIPMNFALRQLNKDFPEAGLYAVNWWDLGFEVIPKIRKSSQGLHADEIETSVSLVIQPENVSLDEAENELPAFSLSEKWVAPDFYGPKRLFYHSRKRIPRYGSGSGVMGDATVSSVETGEKIIDAVVHDLAEIIVEVVNSTDSN